MKKLRFFKALFVAAALALVIPGCSGVDSDEGTNTPQTQGNKVALKISASEGYRTALPTVDLSSYTYELTADVMTENTPAGEPTSLIPPGTSYADLTKANSVYVEADKTYLFVLKATNGSSGDILSGTLTQAINASNNSLSFKLFAIDSTSDTGSVSISVTYDDGYGVASVVPTLHKADGTSLATTYPLAYTAGDTAGTGTITGSVPVGTSYVKVVLYDKALEENGAVPDGAVELGSLPLEAVYAVKGLTSSGTVNVQVKKYKATIALTTSDPSAPTLTLKNPAITTEGYAGISLTSSSETSPYTYTGYVSVGTYAIYIGDAIEPVSGKQVTNTTEVSIDTSKSLTGIKAALASGTYFTGTTLDELKKAITITGVYNDSSSETLGMADVLDGVTVTGDYDPTATAEQTLTVKYGEFDAVTVKVTLEEDYITEWSVALKDSVSYKEGNTPKAEDVVVKAKWASAPNTEVTLTSGYSVPDKALTTSDTVLTVTLTAKRGTGVDETKDVAISVSSSFNAIILDWSADSTKTDTTTFAKGVATTWKGVNVIVLANPVTETSSGLSIANCRFDIGSNSSTATTSSDTAVAGDIKFIDGYNIKVTITYKSEIASGKKSGAFQVFLDNNTGSSSKSLLGDLSKLTNVGTVPQETPATLVNTIDCSAIQTAYGKTTATVTGHYIAVRADSGCVATVTAIKIEYVASAAPAKKDLAVNGSLTAAYTIPSSATGNKGEETTITLSNVSVPTTTVTVSGDTSTTVAGAWAWDATTVTASASDLAAGKVTAKATFTPTDTSAYNTLAAQDVTITVTDERAEASPSTDTVTMGASSYIIDRASTTTASATSANGNAITFASENINIFTVDASTGVMTPVHYGTATLTATSSENASATATVKVSRETPIESDTFDFRTGYMVSGTTESSFDYGVVSLTKAFLNGNQHGITINNTGTLSIKVAGASAIYIGNESNGGGGTFTAVKTSDGTTDLTSKLSTTSYAKASSTISTSYTELNDTTKEACQVLYYTGSDPATITLTMNAQAYFPVIFVEKFTPVYTATISLTAVGSSDITLAYSNGTLTASAVSGATVAETGYKWYIDNALQSDATSATLNVSALTSGIHSIVVEATDSSTGVTYAAQYVLTVN